MERSRMVWGLIGYPLEHSQSPGWFRNKFGREGLTSIRYRLFPLHAISEFPVLLQANPGLTGLNVTIPYKERILPYLDELDAVAASVGAVNAIRIERKHGKFHTIGYNTDAEGFLMTLTRDMPPGPALILGTGGAAKAVAYALNRKQFPFRFVSRHPDHPGILAYEELSGEVMAEYRMIINATPLGMYPQTKSLPSIPYDLLTPDQFLYDLVYNPEETEFLRRGKAMKARTMNGRRMLENQAELSFGIFSAPAISR